MLWKDFLSLEGEANRSKGIVADAIGLLLVGCRWVGIPWGVYDSMNECEKVRWEK